jgi:hypothetical protein
MDILVDGESISDVIALNGFHWNRKDVEGPNAGTNLNGNRIRDRVASKIDMEFSCVPLRPARFSGLMQQIAPEYVTVNLDDPIDGDTSKIMYAPSAGAGYDKSTNYWTDAKFTLEER